VTPEQFDALAKLLRLQPATPSATAARLHFVDGLRPSEAARQAGCTEQAAGNSISRCRAGVDLAKIVAAPPPL